MILLNQKRSKEPKARSKKVVDRILREAIDFYGEFDPGSGRTLAACLTHASRTEFNLETPSGVEGLSLVADG